MKIRNHAAVVAVASSCLFAFAVPNAASAAEREPVQARISTRGLDPRTDSGRRMLEMRIVSAARAICIPNGASLTMRLDALRCVNEMRADGTRKLAALAGDKAVQLAGLPAVDRAE